MSSVTTPGSANFHKMRRVSHLHFVGVGGAGMGGIAEVMLNLGYQVSGSDLKSGAMTERLSALGVDVYVGHAAENVESADVVVVSSAIDASNPEIQRAQAKRIPIIRRAQMLAELMRFRYGIAIAGTHGKTTTTSLISTIFSHAGLDPTYVIGGLLNSAGTNAKLGESKYLIAEADESDASFLHLQPTLSVITNIEADHLEAYQGDFSNMQTAYVEFLHNLPFYGLAVVCGDDDIIMGLLPRIERKVISYGLKEHNDYQISEIKFEAQKSTFKLRKPSGDIMQYCVNLPGVHNVLNATAAIAVASDENIDDHVIQDALLSFEGIGRRFQVLGNFPNNAGIATLVDDYGHHPTEVSMTIKAARTTWPNRRLVMIYQPHRFTRTRDLYEEFVNVLAEVDVLILLDVYSAGEHVIEGADSKALCRSIRLRGALEPIYASSAAEMFKVLANVIDGNDVVFAQGAGTIGELAQHLAKTKLDKSLLVEKAGSYNS